MKTLLATIAALLMLAAPAVQAEPIVIEMNGVKVPFFSASCMSGAQCSGIGRETTVEDHLFNGLSVEQLNAANELIEIDENTVFPANAVLRTNI